MWSIATLVMTDTSGTTTFVESRRPPKPTSTTAYSTPALAKCQNAAAVIISNSVGRSTPSATIASTA